jgi:hypothetical protein
MRTLLATRRAGKLEIRQFGNFLSPKQLHLSKYLFVQYAVRMLLKIGRHAVNTRQHQTSASLTKSSAT